MPEPREYGAGHCHTYQIGEDVSDWEDGGASELNDLTSVTAVLELLVHSGEVHRGWSNGVAVDLASLCTDLRGVQSHISDSGGESLALGCGKKSQHTRA